jgi:hypothetical protein
MTSRVNSLDMSSCALHMGRWVISPTALILSRISVPLISSRISVLTDQLNSIHRGVRSGESLSHMALHVENLQNLICRIQRETCHCNSLVSSSCIHLSIHYTYPLTLRLMPLGVADHSKSITLVDNLMLLQAH